MKKTFYTILLAFICHFANAQNIYRLLNTGFGTTIRCVNDNGDGVSAGRYYSYQNDAWTQIEAAASELVSFNNTGQVSGSMPYDTVSGTSQPAYRDANGVWHAIGWFSSTAGPDDFYTTYKISHNGRFVTGQMSQNNFISSVFKYDTQNSSMHQIATPTNQSIAAYSVNNAGYTGGWYDTGFGGGGTFREACYTDPNNAIHFVPTVTGTHTQGTVNDINDANLMVGEMDTAAFLYNLNTNNLQTFQHLPGYWSMSFTSISNTGVAVGYVHKLSDWGDVIRDAVVYAPQLGNQPRLLKTMLEAAGVTLGTPDSLVGTAYSISPNGRYIAGWNGPYFFGYGFIVDLEALLLATATNDLQKVKPLSIAPNPANSQFYLQNAAIDFPAQLELIDVLGKTIFSQNVTSANTPISTQNMANGVYIARLKTKEQEFRNKLVIEK